MAPDLQELQQIARRVRYLSLLSAGCAGSGHPTSALSATDLMTGLFFGGTFRYNPGVPAHPCNDRMIFSKGHATPLYYALWAVAGMLSEEEIRTYRQFDSLLEGHPAVKFPYVEAATGSLGQGLSIGVGMALNAKYVDQLSYRTYVLLGDSEMAEGSQWEALQLAAHYGLDNLVGVLDVNRLGQRGVTMYGHDLEAYRARISAFGWETVTIDGHSFPEILNAFEKAAAPTGRPLMIIARTVKGKGVPFLEDQDGWHGKAVENDELDQALNGLGKVDRGKTAAFAAPPEEEPRVLQSGQIPEPDYSEASAMATRTAYGHALKRIYPKFPAIISLDAEVSNSTRAGYFQKAYPERFFEMYVAEQNMVGTALGLSCRGKIPFVSTFGAFLSRAFDQIRMAQYSAPNIKFMGSHAGVSIGEDGPSQMALEDLAMFRTLRDSAVLYPCDAIATERLVEAMAAYEGICYLRATRSDTPVLYSAEDEFRIGGSKVLAESDSDEVTVVTAGITVFEALNARNELQDDGISIRVIDLYSVKPVDVETLKKAAEHTSALITVEDHYPEGGLGEAVISALADAATPVYTLAVREMPRSGKPGELLEYEQISKQAIRNTVRSIVGR